MLIPSSDLQNGRIVQLVQGDKLAIETTDTELWIGRFERTMRVTFMVSVPPVNCHSNSLPPPSGSVGLGAASGTSLFLNSTR